MDVGLHAEASPIRARVLPRNSLALDSLHVPNFQSSGGTSPSPSPRSSAPVQKLSWRARRHRTSSMESQQIAGIKRDEEAVRQNDHYNMVLLIVLYMLQGVPMGLVMGSIPFLLQSKLSYTELGILSIASYPYALKLFWSPIVDACYSKQLGRRKSWIVPIQLAAGVMMYIIGLLVDDVFAQPVLPVYSITLSFLCLILLVATQDIAVDGWALTLLSKPMRGWASTCQTIGLNSGFFMSFTIFLALSSPEFCNKYLRMEPQSEGLLSLSAYLRVWGLIYIVITIYLVLFKDENPFVRMSATSTVSEDHGSSGLSGKSSSLLMDHGEKDKQTRENERKRQLQKEKKEFRRRVMVVDENDEVDEGEGKVDDVGDEVEYMEEMDDDDDNEDVTVKMVFGRIWKLVNLPNMRVLLVILLVYKLGFMAADSVSALKLIEKGFKKEDMALFVLIEFPFQILFAILAGRWASGSAPLTSFMVGFKLRLVIGALGGLVIYFFPSDGISTPYYLLVLSLTLATSFAGTIQFVSQGAFFTRISDLSIGGTYLTLLNTFANLGGTWPKFFVFYAVDLFTVKQCVGEGEAIAQVGTCVAKESADQCAALGGECVTEMDGYYPVMSVSFVIGLFLCVLLQYRLVPLERLNASAWKSKQ